MQEEGGGPQGPAAPRRYFPLPQGLAVCRRILREIGRIELTIAVTAFVAVVVLNVVQITLRPFGAAFFWGQEVSQSLALVAYFIGTSSIFRSRHYIIVEFIVQRFAPAMQRQVYLLAQFLAIVFCMIIIVESLLEVPLLLTNYSVILHVPKLYSYLPLIIGSVSIVITSIYYGVAVWICGRHHPAMSVADLEHLVVAG